MSNDDAPSLTSPDALLYYTMRLAESMANEAPWNADLQLWATMLRAKWGAREVPK